MKDLIPQFGLRISARNVSDVFQSTTGSEEHIATLRSEASRIANRSQNPAYTSGFESGLNWALSNIAERFGVSTSLPEETMGVVDHTPPSKKLKPNPDLSYFSPTKS